MDGSTVEAVVVLCILITIVCVALTAIALLFGGRDEW